MSVPRSWPPPVRIRSALCRARRRYHRIPLVQRPALGCPASIAALFPLLDLIALAKMGYYPLPPCALRWLATPPSQTRHRRRRFRCRIAPAVRQILAAELPAAVTYLAGRVLP
jgi:hypothetical protein